MPLHHTHTVNKHIRRAVTITRYGRIPLAHMLIGGTTIDRDGTILDETSRNIHPRERGSDGTGIVTTPRIPRFNSRRRRATQRLGLIHGFQTTASTNCCDNHRNEKNVTNLIHEHGLLLSGRPCKLWSA